MLLNSSFNTIQHAGWKIKLRKIVDAEFDTKANGWKLLGILIQIVKHQSEVKDQFIF